jgi:hypothetical protein
MPNENKHRALYIGLGGSGVKTVLKTRRRLRERTEGDNDRQRDDAFDNLYRFVLIDTDKLARSMEDGTSGEDGSNLSRGHVNLGPVVPKTVYDAAKKAQNRTERQRRLIEFIGTTCSKDIKAVALHDGAGAYRINSRIGLYEHYEDAKRKISEAIESLISAGNPTGMPPGTDLHVWVVSGLAGGTGSGILLDVLYLADRLLRQKGQSAPKIRAVLFTPGSFSQFHVPEIIMSNGFSAMQELAYFLDKSNENQFKHVSVVPDDPNWTGAGYEGWPVYHSAIPIDSTIKDGSSINDTSLYENSAEMLAYLQDSAGGAASSPLDNTLQNAAGTDRLIAFGYVALRKPVQLFTRYIHERRRFEVLHAFLGKEFVASPENSRLASDWIDRVIESLIGRILTRNDALEKQFAGDNAHEPSREQLDLMAARDEEQAMTQEGGDTGMNLRRSVKARFQNLNGGNETGVIDTLEELITASFNNTFYDEKGKFIKKGASQNCRLFAEEVLKRIGEAESDCLTHFRDNRSPMSEDQFRQHLKNSIRTSVNRIICDHGVAFTTGLVATCDADLDNLRQTTLTVFTENLQRMRLSLLAEIQAFPVEVESDANLLFEKAKILLAIVKELLVARFQSEVIAWLCAGDNGWLDQEVERGLADLKGEAVKVCEMARFDYETNLPKLFTQSAAEVTTRYLPNPVDMLSGGKWGGDRDNEFSRYYASLFAGNGSLPAGLLRTIGSIQGEDFRECLFASFLPPNSGGISFPSHRIMAILEKEISAATERAFKNNTDSEAADFLRKPLADVYRDAIVDKKTDVRYEFQQSDKLFFPTNAGQANKETSIAIYAGSNQTFARTLSYEPTDTWIPQSDSDVLMKLNFKGAFSFRNYSQYGSAEGSYSCVQKKVITQGEQGHQPHIHRSFFNSAQSGENVKEAMQSLIPAAQELMGGITHPYDEFNRLFATCWLYSELLHPYRGKDVQHLPPEVLESVFEQELVVTKSAYAPVKFELSKAMVYVSWVDSADAIQTLPDHGKVRIVPDRIKKRVGQFKGNVFDGFEIMRKDKDCISLILKDFERKLRSTLRRADLENGLESAIKEMRDHLPLCQADPRTNWKLVDELAEINALLDENGILPHVRYILTA